VKGQINESEFENVIKKYVHEAAVYAQDEFNISDRLSVGAGLRAPYFQYKKTKYWGIEPRLTLNYLLNEHTSLKTGYTRMHQFVHLLTNSTATTPLDLWIPSSDSVKPRIADQVALGIFKNFKNDLYETSIEAYYKHMKRQIEYEEGANVFLENDVDELLVFGKGWSYGLEFFVQKKEGRFNGWIGYTLSWTRRQFDELNNGEVYPAKYDRRHDFSIVANYALNERWAVSAVFVYGTGHSLTLPVGRFFVPIRDWFNQEGWYYDYGSKNGFKLRPYNRLDLGIKRTTEHKRFTSELRFDIYNVYSRRNPYFVYLQNEYDHRTNSYKHVAKQVSLLPMIPSVSYNFKF